MWRFSCHKVGQFLRNQRRLSTSSTIEREISVERMLRVHERLWVEVIEFLKDLGINSRTDSWSPCKSLHWPLKDLNLLSTSSLQFLLLCSFFLAWRFFHVEDLLMVWQCDSGKKCVRIRLRIFQMVIYSCIRRKQFRRTSSLQNLIDFRVMLNCILQVIHLHKEEISVCGWCWLQLARN